MRCPDPEIAQKMIERVDEIRRTGNSIGGVVEVVARNVPSGLGSPVFDKLEADLAKACMSLPASKGFEVEIHPIAFLEVLWVLTTTFIA